MNNEQKPHESPPLAGTDQAVDFARNLGDKLNPVRLPSAGWPLQDFRSRIAVDPSLALIPATLEKGDGGAMALSEGQGFRPPHSPREERDPELDALIPVPVAGRTLRLTILGHAITNGWSLYHEDPDQIYEEEFTTRLLLERPNQRVTIDLHLISNEGYSYLTVLSVQATLRNIDEDPLEFTGLSAVLTALDTQTAPFHERFAAARKADGLSQEELGEKLGTTGRTVSRWETGISVPQKRFVMPLMDLGLPVE